MSTHIPARNVAGDQIYRGTDVSGEDIQHILIADSAGNLVGTATADPAGGTRGLVVRNIPGGVQPVTDNGGSLTVDAPVGTPVYTRLSDGTAALTTTSGRLSVDASGVAVPITDNAGSLTVDAPVGTPAHTRLSDGATAIGSTAQRLHVDDGGSSLSVDDNAGSLTVDAPVGTPAYTRLSDGTAALTTSGGRLSVDASGVAVPITDNAGSLTVDDGAGSLTVDAPVGTPAYARLSDGSAALIGQKAMAASLPVSVASDQSAMPIRGGALSTTTNTITTSTGTVTTGDIEPYNNITVLVYGTHAGFNVTFEVSPNSGTTYTPLVGGRLDGTGTESVTGVLTSDSTRAWEFTVPSVNRFQVRATARTSGTLNVVIVAGTMPLEPVVNAIVTSPPSRVERTLTTAGAGGTTYAAQTGVTTEALINLSSQLGGTASNATTTFTPTAGKTFKITAISLQVISGAAAIHFARAHLRVNTGGTATASSPVFATLTAYTPVATSGVSGAAWLPVDINILSGWSFGISHIETATTTTTWVTLFGYEF